MSTLDIVTFAWMNDDDDNKEPGKQLISWWENDRVLMQQYAKNLAAGIDKTLTLLHRKILFTNRIEWFSDLADTFLLIEMQPRYKRIMNKLIAYDPAYPISERMILTDLDMVFIKNWDHLARYQGDFITNNNRGTKKVLRWSPGGGFTMTNKRTAFYYVLTKPLYDNPEKAYKKCKCRERVWYSKQIGNNKIDYWQQFYPHSIASYKQDILRRNLSIDDFCILWFHGNPRPHTVNKVKKNWNHNF